MGRTVMLDVMLYTVILPVAAFMIVGIIIERYW